MFFQILPLWGRDEHKFSDDELWSGAGNPRVRSCQGSVRSRILQLDPSHPIGLIVRPYVKSFNCEYGACISLDHIKIYLQALLPAAYTVKERGKVFNTEYLSHIFASKSEYNS